MYSLVYIISAIIRFFLPIAYIDFYEKETQADLFNVFIGGVILHFLSRFLTRFMYTAGVGDSERGSFGYLMSYSYLMVIIMLEGMIIPNAIVAIILFAVIYTASIILFNKAFNR